MVERKKIVYRELQGHAMDSDFAHHKFSCNVYLFDQIIVKMPNSKSSKAATLLFFCCWSVAWKSCVSEVYFGGWWVLMGRGEAAHVKASHGREGPKIPKPFPSTLIPLFCA